MSNRICLVTGASSGIGYETALGLSRLGARVGVVGRDAMRTEAAAARIRAETGGAVDAFTADLSLQAEIRRLGAAVRARYDRLDVLVNNAGAIFGERRLTPDGHERTWALDHLAYVLMTDVCLDLLRAGPGGRIVNVASAAHHRGCIRFDDLDSARSFRPMKTYAQAKLANVMFTYALARHLAGSGITTNAVHPGVVASRFAEGTGGLFGFGWRLVRPFMITPAEGARTSLHVAAAPALAGVSGRYFAKEREAKSSRASHDRAAQDRLWTISREQVGLGA